MISACAQARLESARGADASEAADVDYRQVVRVLDPECMLDLIDLPEAVFINWDALGYGCRAPFYKASTKARRKPKIGEKKRLARAAA